MGVLKATTQTGRLPILFGTIIAGAGLSKLPGRLALGAMPAVAAMMTGRPIWAASFADRCGAVAGVRCSGVEQRKGTS